MPAARVVVASLSRQYRTKGAGGVNRAPPESASPQADALENSNFWTDMFGSILGGTSVEDAVKSASDHAVQTFQDFGAKGA